MKRRNLDLYTSRNTCTLTDITTKTLHQAKEQARKASIIRSFPVVLYGYNGIGWVRYENGKITEQSIMVIK